jgi:hypothetical protein
MNKIRNMRHLIAMSLLTGYARVIDQEQNGQGVKALCVIKVKLSVAIKNLKLLKVFNIE